MYGSITLACGAFWYAGRLYERWRIGRILRGSRIQEASSVNPPMSIPTTHDDFLESCERWNRAIMAIRPSRFTPVAYPEMRQ